MRTLVILLLLFHHYPFFSVEVSISGFYVFHGIDFEGNLSVKSLRIDMSIIQQPGIQSMNHKLSWFQLMSKHTTFDFIQLLHSQPAHILDSLIHEKNSEGLTLLYEACMRSDATLVAALLKLGSSYDFPTANGVFLIHIAAAKGQPLILELLKRAGMQLNKPDFQGRLISHYAAEYNQVCILAYLHECTESFYPNATDNNGLTPLHLACSTGSKQAVQYLLKYFNELAPTLSPNSLNTMNNALIKDFSGNTCLHTLFCKPLGSSTQCPGKKRVTEVLWILLTSLPNYAPHQSPILMIKSINKSNQSPLDLARQANVPKSVLWLLYITSWLVSNYEPSRARSYLIHLYSFIWVLSGLLPLLCFVLFAFLVYLFDSNWLFIVATALILFYATKQRHRLNDGTNRPNPFFAGVCFSGFIASLFCYLNYLLNCGLSIYPYLSFFVLICFSIVSVLWILVFTKLLLMNPGQFRPSHSSLSLLIQNQLDHIACLIDDPKPTHSKHHPFAFLPFVDLYCPHCNLVNTNDHDHIKHCKLCESCFPNMDHHCLFILHCVAHSNHHYFIILLILTILFTSLFLIACLPAVSHTFSTPELWTSNSTNFYLLRSLSSSFVLPFILILSNLFTWFWALTLLQDQLNSIVLNQPSRFGLKHQLKSYSRWLWLRHLKTILGFIVYGKRSNMNQVDLYL